MPRVGDFYRFKPHLINDWYTAPGRVPVTYGTLFKISGVDKVIRIVDQNVPIQEFILDCVSAAVPGIGLPAMSILGPIGQFTEDTINYWFEKVVIPPVIDQDPDFNRFDLDI